MPIIWNEAQQMTLAVLPKISSIFSLAGSSWIVIEVWTGSTVRSNRHMTVPHRTQPYHRLILAMSIYDIIESVWNFASTWPMVAGTTDVFGNVGTTGTCSAQGFFLMLGVAVPIYNACLSLYYYLVIRRGLSEETLQRRVEPAMHAVAFVWGMGTAVAALWLQLYNDANLWCWIAPLPEDCLDSWRYGDAGNCERGDNAWIYRWAFYFAPLWFCIVFASTCLVDVRACVFHSLL